MHRPIPSAQGGTHQLDRERVHEHGDAVIARPPSSETLEHGIQFGLLQTCDQFERHDELRSPQTTRRIARRDGEIEHGEEAERDRLMRSETELERARDITRRKFAAAPADAREWRMPARCPECGSAIVRTTVASRPFYFCPLCQNTPGRARKRGARSART